MSMIGNFLRVSQADFDSYLADSSLLVAAIYNDNDEDNPNLTDIDKAWNGILFLLTGQGLEEMDHPLSSVFFSGQLIDEEQDMGYGPAHYLTPTQVAALHEEISKITTAELKQRFDPQQMTTLGIYPDIWEEGDEAFNYLASYFADIQQVYKDATDNKEAIITFIN